jgi:hypothetical protein
MNKDNLAINVYVSTQIHKTIILSVVLYEYETWSLTLREAQRQNYFV